MKLTTYEKHQTLIALEQKAIELSDNLMTKEYTPEQEIIIRERISALHSVIAKIK